MISKLKVAITTVSFSKNKKLIDQLKSHGFKEIKLNKKGKRLTRKELVEFLKDADIAIIGLDNIDEFILKNTNNLKAISKYGVGLDNIDFDACKNFNVEVLYSIGINKRSVAEMTLGFMLALCRNLFFSSNSLKHGSWDKNGGVLLSHKTIGIIGVGNIGKELISLLKPFGCKILVNDIIPQDEYYQLHNLQEISKKEIFLKADIVTLHTPLTEKTRNIVNKESLSLMQPTSFLINTSRGAIVNQNDLKWALKNNVIGGAAVDVYEIEPPIDYEFISLKNLICTPHIGGNAREAVEAMGMAAIDNLLKWIKDL